MWQEARPGPAPWVPFAGGSVTSRRSRSRPGRQRAQWGRGARGAGPGAVGGPL